MSNARTYLDYNATAPLRPQARAAMIAALDETGNASSVHHQGRHARALIEQARAALAALVQVPAGGIVFTSGGTEAANLVLTPSLRIGRERRPFDVLLIGAGEHPCVLHGHRFAAEQVIIVPFLQNGVLDLDALDAILEQNGGKRPLLALQAANNETGVVQPVAAAAARVKAAGGACICDSVQALGRTECTAVSTGADVLIFAAHKIGGPMGVGALAFVDENSHIADVLVRGGGQERGQRAGTENVAAIAGFGAAAASVRSGWQVEAAKSAVLRDRLEATLLHVAADSVVFGAGVARLANTSAFAVPGVSAETLLMSLDLDGIAVSSGSACSSGRVGKSHVLAAMAIDPALARGAIRASLGWASTPADIERFGEALARAVGRIQRRYAA